MLSGVSEAARRDRDCESGCLVEDGLGLRGCWLLVHSLRVPLLHCTHWPIDRSIACQPSRS